MFWKAASPETEAGNKFTRSYKVNGFIEDPYFSHPDSFCCTWSSSLFPRCICRCLLSCCWPARPREPQPAACQHIISPRVLGVLPSLHLKTSETPSYDFSPRASCCRTLKPNKVSLGALKIRGFFTSMLKLRHSSEKENAPFICIEHHF